MPRRIKLTPEQNEILRQLEEAGGETIATLLNTLRIVPGPGGMLSPATVRTFEGLAELGLIEWLDCAVGLSQDCAVYDSATSQWRSMLAASGKPLNILLTKTGRRALVT
jgi:Fe2+ or Zn2+ uptake regulation protein